MGIKNTFRSCLHAMMGVNAQHRDDCEKLSEVTGFNWSTFIVMEPQENRVYYHARFENKRLASRVADELNQQANSTGFSTVGTFNLSVRKRISSEVLVKTKHFINDISSTDMPNDGKGDVFLDLTHTAHSGIARFISDMDAETFKKSVSEYYTLEPA